MTGPDDPRGELRRTRSDAAALLLGAGCIMVACLVGWQAIVGALSWGMLGIAVPVMLMVLGALGMWSHHRARSDQGHSP